MLRLQPKHNGISSLLIFLFLGAPVAPAEKVEHMPVSEHVVNVVIRLRSDVAEAARGNTTTPSGLAAAHAIEKTVHRFGGSLRPQHPASADPSLSGYFVANVDSTSAAEALAAEVRSLKGVEAAYIKPPPGMPY